MRYVILAVLVGPFIALGRAVVIATTDGTLALLYQPATFLPIVANNFHAQPLPLRAGFCRICLTWSPPRTANASDTRVHCRPRRDSRSGDTVADRRNRP
jgi:hypothetical protein